MNFAKNTGMKGNQKFKANIRIRCILRSAILKIKFLNLSLIGRIMNLAKTKTRDAE